MGIGTRKIVCIGNAAAGVCPGACLGTSGLHAIWEGSVDVVGVFDRGDESRAEVAAGICLP